MSEHSNSKNSNYSNFSFANYLKNPADIPKNEYENYLNNNLEEYTENFNSLDNYQSENIPNFGVAPKFVSTDIELSANNENVANIKLVDYTKSVPKVTSPHVTGLAPNYLAQTINNNYSLPKFTSLHGNGLVPNYFPESTVESAPKATSLHDKGLYPNYITESPENIGPAPVYNTRLMLNDFNVSKLESFHKIPSNKESHKSSNDNNNSEFEKFIEFTCIDEIFKELAKGIKHSNQVLLNEFKHSNQMMLNEFKHSNQMMLNEFKHSNQMMLNEFKHSNQMMLNEFKHSNQMLANELKNAVKAMNDSVKNQTELTSSIKSLVEEFKKTKKINLLFFYKKNN